MSLKLIVPTLLLVFVAFQLASPTVHAQFGGGDFDQTEMLTEQFRQQLVAAKKSGVGRLKARIEDLNRAVELDDAQRKKLEVAAKGAVESFVEFQRGKLAEQAEMMELEIDVNELSVDDDGESESEEDGWNFGGPQFFFQGAEEKTIEEEERWTNAVEKTLSEEQAEAWSGWLEKRADYLRTTAVSDFVARVDDAALLTEDQRAKLNEILTDQFSDTLVENYRQQLRSGSGVFMMSRWNTIQLDSDEKVVTCVAEVLDGEQLNIWKEHFASQLMTEEELMRLMEDGAGGFF